MIGGYGIYVVEFMEKDGTPDRVKAKAAFEWCMKNYEWFSSDMPLSLHNEFILWNVDQWENGIEISRPGVPHTEASLRKWILQMGMAVDADVIVGDFYCDYTKTEGEDCSYRVLYSDKKIISCGFHVNGNDYACGIPRGHDTYTLIDVGDTSSRYLRGVFRNKLTGKKKYGGYVISTIKDYDSWQTVCKFSFCADMLEGHEPILCTMNGEYVEPWKVNANYWEGGFDHFDDEDFEPLKMIPIEYVDSYAEWEFIGFNYEPNYLDRALEKIIS